MQTPSAPGSIKPLIRVRPSIGRLLSPTLVAGAVALASCVIPAPNLEEGFRITPEGRATEPAIPLMVESDEATADQLQLARAQGDAYKAAVDWLLHERGAVGAEMGAGEYQIAYALTEPEGWWELVDGRLVWRDPPADANAHLKVVVRDAADGRIVPGLDVRATLLAPGGREVATTELPFGWHPVIHNYGENIRVPGEGVYTLRVVVEPPPYWRHDPDNGDRYTEPALAEFIGVRIAPDEIPRLTRRAEDLTRQALPLARDQGNAIKRALDEMIAAEAIDGAETRVGDYLVGYAVEYAEGWWYWDEDDLIYRITVEESAEENAHFEVSVRDALTGRLLPGLDVVATVIEPDGEVVDTREQRFMWHPWLYHYGQNWRVPRTGTYRFRIRFEPPGYRRYGRVYGRRFTEPVVFEFTDVDVVTGQK